MGDFNVNEKSVEDGVLPSYIEEQYLLAISKVTGGSEPQEALAVVVESHHKLLQELVWAYRQIDVLRTKPVADQVALLEKSLGDQVERSIRAAKLVTKQTRPQLSDLGERVDSLRSMVEKKQMHQSKRLAAVESALQSLTAAAKRRTFLERAVLKARQLYTRA